MSAGSISLMISVSIRSLTLGGFLYLRAGCGLCALAIASVGVGESKISVLGVINANIYLISFSAW